MTPGRHRSPMPPTRSWDCEAQTRRLAARHVGRRVRLAAQRLHELAADDHQAASVRAAAVERLRD